MKWYTVFNSRTKFSDYRNIMPLPEMPEGILEAYRNQRLAAQNGIIDNSVHVTACDKQVLILSIRLTEEADQYGRRIRCAEGLYGVSEDLRREWEEVIDLAVRLWSKDGTWYNRVIQGEEITALKPERAQQLLRNTEQKKIGGALSPDALLNYMDTICSFVINDDGIAAEIPENFAGRSIWSPANGNNTYCLRCFLSRVDKKAWIEAVDGNNHEERCVVRSEAIEETGRGFRIDALEDAAETIRAYLNQYGWRERS